MFSGSHVAALDCAVGTGDSGDARQVAGCRHATGDRQKHNCDYQYAMLPSVNPSPHRYLSYFKDSM
jgi:hypothetical protein